MAWAAVLSTFKPLTDLERKIPAWPPASPLNPWAARVFLSPWERWDVLYYANIALRGYRLDDGTAQFHPLFPWLSAPFGWLTGQPLFGLLVISSLAGLASLMVFERLACMDMEHEDARASALFMLFSPFACVLFVPYTESLFLLWALLSMFWARKRRWWLAGFAGGLAVLTRQQGVLLFVPLSWELWESSGHDWRRFLDDWRKWLSLGLVFAGWIVWAVYRAVALGDLNPDFSTVHTLVYSLFISPSAAQVVPVQTFMWPWEALQRAVVQVLTMADVDLVTNLVLAVYFIILLCISWRGLRTSYRLYSLAVVFISFSYYTGPVHPYMGLPRHLFLAFPAFLALGERIREPWQRLLVNGAGLLGSLFLLLLYVFETWVP